MRSANGQVDEGERKSIGAMTYRQTGLSVLASSVLKLDRYRDGRISMLGL